MTAAMLNVFVLSRNVKTCAALHGEGQLASQPGVCARILELAAQPEETAGEPWARWAGRCINNYLWLSRLGLELCSEYSRRAGEEHEALPRLAELRREVPPLPKFRHCTEFPIIVPADCLRPGDVVSSYRCYYEKYVRNP